MKTNSIHSLLCAAALALLLSSCGTAYRSEWNAAAAHSQEHGAIEGAWIGTWHSDVNGHTGKLWCLIKDGAPNERTFAYRATWGHILSGSFSAKHNLQKAAGATIIKVDHPIGKLGTFHGEGKIQGDKFTACYQAAGDRGTFELKRPLLSR